jgi:hypothetical protein
LFKIVIDGAVAEADQWPNGPTPGLCNQLLNEGVSVVHGQGKVATKVSLGVFLDQWPVELLPVTDQQWFVVGNQFGDQAQSKQD